MYKWIVTVAGGRGPETWEREFTVDGNNVEEAAASARQQMQSDPELPSEADIVCIEAE